MKICQPHVVIRLPLKGRPLFALHRLSRKRVNMLLQAYLLICNILKLFCTTDLAGGFPFTKETATAYAPSRLCFYYKIV